MSGARTFLPCPPDVRSNSISSSRNFVLLTAADGINCSFQLLVVNMDTWSIKIQTTTSRGTWRPVTHVINKAFLSGAVERRRDPVVLHGGIIINWLVDHDNQILSYDLGERKQRTIKLPHTNCDNNRLHLTTSSDGKLLKLLVIDGFMMSVWLQLPISPSAGNGWSLETVIDMEEKLRLLHPNIPTIRPGELVGFGGPENWSGDNVLFLRVPGPDYYDKVTVFDLETKDMHTQCCGYSLLEIDLPSRLRNMKTFP
jgi:hypothetical protein